MERRLYDIQFPYFIKQMYQEMDRHHPTKGDSYHDCTVEEMEKILKAAIEQYWKLDWDYPRKESQCVDIANICAMLYMRLGDI